MPKISLSRGGKIRSSYDTRTRKLTKYVKPRKARLVKPKIPINVFGGNSKVVKMEYVANLSMDTGASPTALLLGGQQSFRLNNVNLPFIGQASGFQLPQGYTQAAQAFKYFKVYGARVRAEFFDPSDDCQVGILPVSSGDTYDLQAVNVTTADMRKECVIKSLSPDGGRRVVLKTYQKISALEGLTPAQFNGDVSLYSQPFNASVTSATAISAGTGGDLILKREPKVHFAIASNGTTQATCKCKVIIHYYVKCWGKTALPQSTSTA